MNKKYKIGDEVLVRGVVNSEVRNGGIHVLHDGVDAFYTLDQIDEPQKVILPKFVAEYLKSAKSVGWSFKVTLNNPTDSVYDWLADRDNQETFARAWFFGYEVEQEQLYTVEIPNPHEIGGNKHVLAKDKDGLVRITFISFINWKESKEFQLTEEKIRKDFEWAWKEGFAKPVES